MRSHARAGPGGGFDRSGQRARAPSFRWRRGRRIACTAEPRPRESGPATRWIRSIWSPCSRSVVPMAPRPTYRMHCGAAPARVGPGRRAGVRPRALRRWIVTPSVSHATAEHTRARRTRTARDVHRTAAARAGGGGGPNALPMNLWWAVAAGGDQSHDRPRGIVGRRRMRCAKPERCISAPAIDKSSSRAPCELPRAPAA